MNLVTLLLIIIALPLLLGGCGENKGDVEINKTLQRWNQILCKFKKTFQRNNYSQA